MKAHILAQRLIEGFGPDDDVMIFDYSVGEKFNINMVGLAGSEHTGSFYDTVDGTAILFMESMNAITEDGHPITVGMKIWVVFNDGCITHPHFIERRIVAEVVSEYKLLYDKPDEYGYIGCRIKDHVFFDENNAVREAKKRNRS